MELFYGDRESGANLTLANNWNSARLGFNKERSFEGSGFSEGRTNILHLSIECGLLSISMVQSPCQVCPGLTY
jgi:hypothetical protein